MDEWHVGDPADWGDSVGVPDIPYMGYLNNGDDEDDDEPPQEENHIIKARNLSDEAWMLEGQGRYKEALVLIDWAIEIFPYYFDHFNRKAIILGDLCRYDEALKCYDKALALKNDGAVLANKAGCMLASLEMKRAFNELSADDLDVINEALKILPDDKSNYSYLHIKGNILEKMGEPVKARICYYLAGKMFDEVEKAERQLKMMADSNETFIAIAGLKFYNKYGLFQEGVVMDLIRETDNKHDRDAIRVEINGQTVGYVANSEYTLIKEVKSASQIRNMESTKAEFLFVLLGEYRIAKLI